MRCMHPLARKRRKPHTRRRMRPESSGMGISMNMKAGLVVLSVLSIRNKAILQERGVSAAAHRPAFGLQLDRSTEAEVLERMSRYKAQCLELSRGLRYLRCRGVPAETLGSNGPPVSEIWFSFAPDHTLMAINVYRRDMSADETRRSWQIAVRNLHNVLGAPTSVSGDTTLETLIGKPVAVARVSFPRFFAFQRS